MKEHKRKEAEERQKLMNGEVEDDVLKKLDELELMEELENELEAVSDEDDDTLQAILNKSVELPPSKKRISHLNEERFSDNHVTTSVESNIESTNDNHDLPSDSDNDDDDDVPFEFKKIEKEAKAMPNNKKLQLFKAKLAEVEEFLQKFKPRTLEEISIKTDKMFLCDHFRSAIETIRDEINCDQYLNGEDVPSEESDSDTLSSIVQSSGPTQTKPILKKNSNKNVSNRKISFALEDDVKSFDRREEPSKISTTVIFEHGPVLNLHINHSEAKFHETSGKSDVIRSPVDIYKQFADCTLNDSNGEQASPLVQKTDFDYSSVSVLI